ncbi:hypothetical protein K1719_044171 [Acacia pycnantha]|nr:hypothetical protein K1719_044171 [Acacia pycnantha]
MDYFARDAIVFTSNGLVCVKLYKRGCSPPPLLVWNPATRDIRQVTKNINDFGDEFYVGFGFSPIASDYKIVMFGFSNHAVSWVEVYSLTFGAWKEVECGSLVGITNLFDQTVTINGVMFWLGLESKWQGLVAFTIVSFDIVMEMFTLIPMPVLDPIRQATLSVHDGRLAMLSIPMTQNFESQFIDLWVLEEAIGSLSGRWSWTKKFANGPFSYYIDPLTIWRNEIFCNVERQGEDASTTIALFNPTTNEFKMDFIDTCSLSGAFNYVESLVPVGGTKFAVYM